MTTRCVGEAAGRRRVTPHWGRPGCSRVGHWSHLTRHTQMACVSTGVPHAYSTNLTPQSFKSSGRKCQKANLTFAASGALSVPAATSAVRPRRSSRGATCDTPFSTAHLSMGFSRYPWGSRNQSPVDTQGHCKHFWSDSHGDTKFLSKAQEATGDILMN